MVVSRRESLRQRQCCHLAKTPQSCLSRSEFSELDDSMAVPHHSCFKRVANPSLDRLRHCPPQQHPHHQRRRGLPPRQVLHRRECPMEAPAVLFPALMLTLRPSVPASRRRRRSSARRPLSRRRPRPASSSRSSRPSTRPSASRPKWSRKSSHREELKINVDATK